MSDEDEPDREHMVAALYEATVDPELSQEHLAELLYNASPQERQAVSDLHGALADLSASRAGSLAHVLQLLAPYWRLDRSLGATLKTAPRRVANRALTVLYDGGWTEADGLPPRPGTGDGEDA